MFKLDLQGRIDDLKKLHLKLDKFARRKVDYYEVIDKQTQAVHDRCVADLQEMKNYMHDSLVAKELKLTEHDELMQKHQALYADMKETNFKQDLKVEQLKTIMQDFHRQMLESESHVDALKAQSLMTDLHMSCFLPFQVASISFEITHSMAKKKQLEKLKERYL